jgi:hypothetical protein
MKSYNYTKDVFPCCFDGETYLYYHNELQTRNGGKSFTGMATFWKEGSQSNKDTVPFYVKADDIEITQEIICKNIERKVRGIKCQP